MHESQTFVLLSQLLLIGTCRLMRQSNIHRNCYLRSQLLHELQIRIVVRVGLPASKGNCPVGLLGRSQWKYVVGSDTALSERANIGTKAVFIGEITQKKRFLVLPYPSRRRITYGTSRDMGIVTGIRACNTFNRMTFRVGSCKTQIEKIESANLFETMEEIPKQFRQTDLRDYRTRHL